jgi:succinate-semialdehyde dehydrogenase/glutarate-semialdehyde dehydrogenase
MKMTLKKKDLLRQQALIDGEWIDAAKGKVFQVANPLDQKEIAAVPDMGKKEAEQAVEAAYFALPAWSSRLAEERARLLRTCAELIRSHKDDLATLLTLEQGKPLRESEEEVLDAAAVIDWYAEEASRIHGTTQQDPSAGKAVMTIRQPIGVAASIVPWNFPLAIAAQKGFAALAAGCTVVLKPSEETPLTALALAFLAQEAGIPPGVLNVVTCKNPERVGEVLTTHPLISKVSFTGSSEVGKKILAQAASTVKHVTLELGGNCPVIIFEDADLEKALKGIFDLKFYNNGQCCNTVNRILVHRSVYDQCVERFISMTAELKVGDGLDRSTDLGPINNSQGLKKLERLLKDAKRQGAKAIGSKTKLKSLLFNPTILMNCHSGMEIFSEEIFGPVVPFYSFDSEDEAVALANDTRYGLAAYFYTEQLSRTIRVSRELEAGSIGINTTNVYSVMLPFGGWKESGIGRELGISDSLNDYCELKSLSIGF